MWPMLRCTWPRTSRDSSWPRAWSSTAACPAPNRCQAGEYWPMPELDWKSARLPDRTPIEGEIVRLEPLDVGRHASQIYAPVVGAAGLSQFLPYRPFHSAHSFTPRLPHRPPSPDPPFHP